MFSETSVQADRALVQLVDSQRNEEGLPRQRIVASLGNAPLPPDKKRTVARCVEQRLLGQRDLFESEPSVEETVRALTLSSLCAIRTVAF